MCEKVAPLWHRTNIIAKFFKVLWQRIILKWQHNLRIKYFSTSCWANLFPSLAAFVKSLSAAASLPFSFMSKPRWVNARLAVLPSPSVKVIAWSKSWIAPGCKWNISTVTHVTNTTCNNIAKFWTTDIPAFFKTVIFVKRNANSKTSLLNL